MPKIVEPMGAVAVERLTEPGKYTAGEVAALCLEGEKFGSRHWTLRVVIPGGRKI